MRMSDPLSVKFSKPTTKTLKQQAKKENKSISDLIRKFVEDGLSVKSGKL